MLVCGSTGNIELATVLLFVVNVQCLSQLGSARRCVRVGRTEARMLTPCASVYWMRLMETGVNKAKIGENSGGGGGYHWYCYH